MISPTHVWNQKEIMDQELLDEKTAEEVNSFFSFTNKFFGGWKIYKNAFLKWSRSWDRNKSILILEAGCGEGDLLRRLADWGRNNSWKLNLIGVDASKTAITTAIKKSIAYPEIQYIEKNINLFLTESSHSFDYICSSLLLHHLPPPEGPTFLQLLPSKSNKGFLVSDLYRSRISYIAVKLISYLKGNHIVKHDGPLSVRRGFRETELNSLIKETGLKNTTCFKAPWFRIVLEGNNP